MPNPENRPNPIAVIKLRHKTQNQMAGRLPHED
jgi:hypothetical protein